MCDGRLTFPQSPTFHSVGQSQTLQTWRSTGGGWGHMWFGTATVLPVPRVTSWMQVTSRVWIPSPQGCVHPENSLVFHLGEFKAGACSVAPKLVKYNDQNSSSTTRTPYLGGQG